jgi:DNA-binding HxlR family transcriptional regulator
MNKRIFKDSGTHLPEFCRPAGNILSRVGDKWTLSIIGRLKDRRLRFSELQNIIEGISQRMLTHTLRSLERDGLVARTVHPTVPPRVEYELTPMGQSLIGPLSVMGQWASANNADIELARRAFDAADAEDFDESRPAED